VGLPLMSMEVFHNVILDERGQLEEREREREREREAYGEPDTLTPLLQRESRSWSRDGDGVKGSSLQNVNYPQTSGMICSFVSTEFQ